MTTRTPPRYEEIADHLRRLVASSRPGDRLPSDAELCEHFGVSRMTARQAVQTAGQRAVALPHPGAGHIRGAAPGTAGARISLVVHRQHAKPRHVCHLADPRIGNGRAVCSGGQGAGSDNWRIRPACWSGSGWPTARRWRSSGSSSLPLLGRARRRSGAGLAPQCLRGQWMDPDPGRSGGDGAARHRKGAALAPVWSSRWCSWSAAPSSDQDGSPLEHTETVYAAERYVFAAVLHRDATDRLG